MQMQISEFKAQFNQASPYIHFNNSGQGPIPLVFKNKMQEWLDKFYFEGAIASIEGWREVENVRKNLAKFIDCDTAEVAFVQTTAAAISQAALAIPFKENDEILTWQQEYPSNFYPWRAAAEKTGAKIKQIETPNFQTRAEDLIENITPRTKAIALSWVQYQTGATIDLKKISKAVKGKNIWLVADIIQGLGVKPFSFADSGFDMVCCGSHKWLCSGYGGAFLVVKRDRIEELNPIEYGAMTYGDPDTIKSFTLKPKMTAQRFEPGSKSMLEIIAMNESLELLQKAGLKNIELEACRLAAQLREGIINLGYEVFDPHDGCIISWSHSRKTHLDESDIKNLNLKRAEVLKKNKVSYAIRGPGVRFSLHAFNTDTEVEKVLKLMAQPL